MIQVSLCHIKLATLESNVNTELANISEWLMANKLSLNIYNNNIQKNLCNLFQLTSNKHKIKTRQATSGLFSQPAMRTNTKQNSIINNGVKIWNKIPIDIRQSKTKNIFKKKYKSWLLTKNS